MSEQPGEAVPLPSAESEPQARGPALPSVWMALVLLVAAYLLQVVVVSLINGFLKGAFGWDESAAFRWSMLIGQCAALLVFPAAMMRRWGFHVRASLGLTRPRVNVLVLTVAGAFCAVVTCQLLGELINHLLPPTFRDMEGYVEDLLPKVATPGVGAWLVVMLTVGLNPAVCEEAVFRGLALGAVRRASGAVVAVLLTSVLFALAHGTPVALATTFLLGLLLALVTVWTGSIWCAVVVHLANNILAVEQLNHLVPYVVAARVVPVPALSIIPAGAGTLLLLGALIWLWRRRDGGLRWPAMFAATVCLAFSLITFRYAYSEARVWLNRSAVYYATIARPGSRLYEWAQSQEWIQPELIRREHARVWMMVSQEAPSAPGAQELAGLITQQGDEQAAALAWRWFQQAEPTDAWQAELLDALQQTPFARQARTLAWSRVLDDADVGLKLARVLDEHKTSSDGQRAAEALGALPADASFDELGDLLREMAGPRPAATTRAGETRPAGG